MRSIVLLMLSMPMLGCVSKTSYQEVQEELLRERAQASALRAELSSRRMKSVENLETQLTACEQRVVATKEAGEKYARKAEEAGYYKGATDFNRSLQIVGVPASTGWWIFADHYYTFQVRVAGQPLYSMTIQTEDKMPPVLQGLALISEIREVMPYKN